MLMYTPWRILRSTGRDWAHWHKCLLPPTFTEIRTRGNNPPWTPDLFTDYLRDVELQVNASTTHSEHTDYSTSSASTTFKTCGFLRPTCNETFHLSKPLNPIHIWRLRCVSADDWMIKSTISLFSTSAQKCPLPKERKLPGVNRPVCGRDMTPNTTLRLTRTSHSYTLHVQGKRRDFTKREFTRTCIAYRAGPTKRPQCSKPQRTTRNEMSNTWRSAHISASSCAYVFINGKCMLKTHAQETDTGGVWWHSFTHTTLQGCHFLAMILPGLSRVLRELKLRHIHVQILLFTTITHLIQSFKLSATIIFRVKQNTLCPCSLDWDIGTTAIAHSEQQRNSIQAFFQDNTFVSRIEATNPRFSLDQS